MFLPNSLFLYLGPLCCKARKVPVWPLTDRVSHEFDPCEQPDTLHEKLGSYFMERRGALCQFFPGFMVAHCSPFSLNLVFNIAGETWLWHVIIGDCKRHIISSFNHFMTVLCPVKSFYIFQILLVALFMP